MIPPKPNAEFVADREAVIEVYETPYEKSVPVVDRDEQPVPMVTDTRPPVPATRNPPKRVDFEDVRAGVASVFLFCEPLAGWRSVSVRERHTKVDWAREVAALLTGRYAKAAQFWPRGNIRKYLKKHRKTPSARMPSCTDARTILRYPHGP